MAILQFDGLDLYGNGSIGSAAIRAAFEAAGFTSPGSSRPFVFATAYGKNAGSYGVRILTTVSTDTVANQVMLSKPIQPEQYRGDTPYAPTDVVILGFAFRLALNPTAELTIGKVGDHEVSVGIDLNMNADGVRTQYKIELAIWNYCEVEISARDMKYRLWMNDLLISELPLAETVVNFDKWEVKAHYKTNGTAGQSMMDADDYYLLDGSVSANNVQKVRLGKVNVAVRLPTADSEVGFTPNAGANNFSRVAEVVPNGDTTYVSSGIPGTKDLYSNPAALTVVDDNAIVAVAVAISARQTEPDSLSLSPTIKNGGQIYSAGRMAIRASLYTSEKGIFELDPATGQRWKPAGVQTATFGQTILDRATPPPPVTGP